MKQPVKLLFLFLFAAFVMSCEKDIIVKDITDKSVTVLAPADNTTTPVNGITFWWEEVDGAERYDVQIVSPSFSTIIQLITDTSVTGDKFTRSLQPGTYQWRIRATNNGGSTPWITRNLTIDSTSNMALITVALNSPADSLYTNVLTQTLTWNDVSAAEDYHLKVYNANTAVSLNDADQATTSKTITFPSADATYIWQVRAQNNYSISSYSSRKIFIDVTPPTAPVPSHPGTSAANTPTVTINTDSLKWSHSASALYDSLYISVYPDSTFVGPVIHTPITSFSGGQGKYGISSGNFAFATGQTYFWKVISIDKAGNRSAYSNFWRFKMN
jgi:hypothetical protein